MKPKTILQFFVILLITLGGMYSLYLLGDASAKRIKSNETSLGKSIVEETSNTDFIFFGSLSKFLVSARIN